MCFKTEREKKYDHFCCENDAFLTKAAMIPTLFFIFDRPKMEKVSVCDIFSNHLVLLPPWALWNFESLQIDAPLHEVEDGETSDVSQLNSQKLTFACEMCWFPTRAIMRRCK